MCLALKFTFFVNKWIQRFNLYEIFKLFGYNWIILVFGRYADFIVNEVDMDGNVVRLTSLDVSPEMVCLYFDSHSPDQWGYFFILFMSNIVCCFICFRMWRRKIKRKVQMMYHKAMLLQLNPSDLFAVPLMQSVWKLWLTKSLQELKMRSHRLFLIQVLTSPRERYGNKNYISTYRHYL